MRKQGRRKEHRCKLCIEILSERSSLMVHRILDRLCTDGWGPDIAAMSGDRAQKFQIRLGIVAKSFYNDGSSLFTLCLTAHQLN